MNTQKMVAYLADNLQIEVNHHTEFGPSEKVTVTLKLGENIISESSCTIPSYGTPFYGEV